VSRRTGDVAALDIVVAFAALEPGARADLVVLRKPLFAARPRDVALVLVAGRLELADEEFAAVFDAAGIPHEPLTAGRVRKRVAAPPGAVARAAVSLPPERGRILS
jgi:hypothetical protein